MRTALQEMFSCSVFHHPKCGLCQQNGLGFHYLYYIRFFIDFKLIFIKSSPHIFPYILQKSISGLCSSYLVVVLPSRKTSNNLDLCNLVSLTDLDLIVTCRKSNIFLIFNKP